MDIGKGNKKTKYIFNTRDHWCFYEQEAEDDSYNAFYNKQEFETLLIDKELKKNVIFLIPALQLITDSFIIPAQAKNKIEELIEFKLNERLSLELSELYYTYYLDNTIIKDKLIVLVFAVRKEYLNKSYRFLTEKNIILKHILPLPALVFFWHRQAARDKIKAIYQDNHSSKNILIYLDRIADDIYFTVFHEQGIFLRKGKYSNIKEEILNVLAYLQNELAIAENASVLESVLNNLQIDFYKDKRKSSPEEILRADTGLELSDRQDSLFQELSLRKKDIKSLDFSNKLAQKKLSLKRKYKFLLAFALSLILLFNLFTFFITMQIDERKVEKNQQKLVEMTPLLKELEDVKNQIERDEYKLSFYNDILKDKGSYLPWIYIISKVLPDDTTINNLNFNKDKMVLLEGKAPSAVEVMEALQDSKMFLNLQFVGDIIIEEGEEFRKERFRITGDLKYE